MAPMTEKPGRRRGLDRGFVLIAIPAVFLCMLFLLLAATRRLNFDEALALHAGWLVIHDIPASPSFCMPFTLALGGLGTSVRDPGVVFLVARLAVAVAVLAALVWCLAGLVQGRGAVLLGLILVLSTGAFVTHGVEFRYDAVLLLGWLLLGGALARPSHTRIAPVILGVVIAVMALHHLKGLYYAGWGYALVLVYLGLLPGARRRKVLAFHAGLLGTVAAWLIFISVTGWAGEFFGVYVEFLDAARRAQGAGRRAPFVVEALSVDLAWWLVTGSLVGWLLWTQRMNLRRRAGWLLAFAATPMTFALLHPGPWLYMLAPAVPFLAALLVSALQEARQRFGVLPVAIPVGLFIALQLVLVGTDPWSPFRDGLRASRGAQVAALRALRLEAAPDDTVLDPSGLAYFMTPAASEWYIDGLFLQSQLQGDWMAPDQAVQMLQADWVLYSYRLAWLPESVVTGIEAGFVPIRPGIGARSHRAASLAAPAIPRVELRSFWARRGGQPPAED